MRILGIDPTNSGFHGVLLDSTFDFRTKEAVVFDASPLSIHFDRGARNAPAKVVIGIEHGRLVSIENPAGTPLFPGMNSVSWSETIASAYITAGMLRGEGCEVEMPTPMMARTDLAELAGVKPGGGFNDKVVRELLCMLAGDDAFKKPKACPKRTRKTHGIDCELCGGSGEVDSGGVFHRCTTPHYRDAIVVALWALKKRASKIEFRSRNEVVLR